VTTPAAAIDDVWIKKWCEQNPTKHLIEAALCICMGSAPRISTVVARQTTNKMRFLWLLVT